MLIFDELKNFCNTTPSRGRLGDDDVSDRGHTDQGGDEGRANPA